MASSGQKSNRTSSVSSLQSTHSNSSLQVSSKARISKYTATGSQSNNSEPSRIPSALAPSSVQSNNSKRHERARSDVTSVKLSAESSSVTSLTALKRGSHTHSK